MNNLTKTTESLPKTGHVNEVCKEWLVREDGALAYKLQSQEINDFYKGNRQRNAVVREDFPTAMHEQIKEQENAQKQVEAYRRRLIEQEEYDKRVAKEIADKLERDIQEQQQRELQESEEIAQRMQEIYVNMPPIPPPSTRDKTRPPPRPAKASTLQQNANSSEQLQQLPTTSNAIRHNKQHNPYQKQHQTHQHYLQQQQQNLQYFADTDGYVGLSVNLSQTPQRQKAHHTNFNNLMVSDEPSVSPKMSQKAYQQSPTTSNHVDNNNFNVQPQYRHQHSNSSSSSAAAVTLTNASLSPGACSPSPPPSSSSSSSAIRRHNVFDFNNITQSQQQSPNSPKTSLMHQQLKSPKHQTQTSNSLSHSPISPAHNLNASVEELLEYSDVADSIRRYDINATTTSTNHTDSLDSPSKINRLLSPSHENLLSSNEKNFQKLSPEKYDQIMGNGALDGEVGAVAGRVNSSNGKMTEQHMQQHADDIELYVDPCDYESLKEIGLPMEEIKEISKKLKQEQKDALLAKRLQEMESGEKLSQEERDRILAIEAQDKELAKMLQEREKAKAKRAKEKARQRKSQHKDQTSCGSSTGLHCGPLLPLPQDCLSSLSSSSSSKQRVPITASPPYTSAQRHPLPTTEDPLDMEAYSNPIDVITNQQRQQNGLLTNGSLTRDSNNGGPRHIVKHNNNGHHRDDDIYTLPVDSCRPGTTTTSNQRPASLIISPDTITGQQHNSMTRSENYSLDSHGSLNGHHDIPPRMNYSKSAVLDQNSSPTPPYMPIQGTRRSNSGEERKKKSKDKCTHQ